MEKEAPKLGKRERETGSRDSAFWENLDHRAAISYAGQIAGWLRGDRRLPPLPTASFCITSQQESDRLLVNFLTCGGFPDVAISHSRCPNFPAYTRDRPFSPLCTAPFCITPPAESDRLLMSFLTCGGFPDVAIAFSTVPHAGIGNADRTDCDVANRGDPCDIRFAAHGSTYYITKRHYANQDGFHSICGATYTDYQWENGRGRSYISAKAIIGAKDSRFSKQDTSNSTF
jgi:hypothetical protein